MIPGNNYRLVNFEYDTISNSVISAGPVVNIPFPSTYTIDEPADGTPTIYESVPYPPWCISNPFPTCEVLHPTICFESTGNRDTAEPANDSSRSSRYGEYKITGAVGFFRDDIFLDTAQTIREEVVTWSTESEGISVTSDYFVDWGYPVTQVICQYFATVVGGYKNVDIKGSTCQKKSVYTISSEGGNIWLSGAAPFRIETKEFLQEISDGWSTSDVGPGSLTQTLTGVEYQVEKLTRSSSLEIPATAYGVELIPIAGFMLTEEAVAVSLTNQSVVETTLEGVWALGCIASGSYLTLPTAPGGFYTYKVWIEGDGGADDRECCVLRGEKE
jgi:hypothetical protein